MVKIRALVENSGDSHYIALASGDNQHSITIPAKSNGQGSSANGAELLFLAVATCFCNDIYREARLRNVQVFRVQVEVTGDYDGVPGHPVENIVYHATVEARASEAGIIDLMRYTDTVAEIQNTLRLGTEVTLGEVVAISVE